MTPFCNLVIERPSYFNVSSKGDRKPA